MVSRSRILVASHAWFGDTIGGAFRLASELAEQLASNGHDVHFLCCQTSQKEAEEKSESRCGTIIHRYPAPRRGMPALLKLRSHVVATKRLTSDLQRQKPFDHLSLHSPLQAYGALWATRGAAAHSNYTVHSPFDEEIVGQQKQGLKRFASTTLARRIELQCCRAAHDVQCDSRYTLSNLMGKFGQDVEGKGFVLPGWVDANHFQPAHDRAHCRGQLAAVWSTNVPVFFTLRRLESRMGLDTLVEASRILKGRGLLFRTLIGGGGSLQASLQSQIESSGLQNDVFLLGRLPESDLPLAYAAADCFVLPTRALECFGLIVLEAFACNTPVIASNVAAIPELAERQGKDWMFEPGDAMQLADRMQAFVEERLKPTVDLRAVAMEYDKPKVLAEWERALLGEERI